MTFAINVKGGTGAGRKRQREKPRPWWCPCDDASRVNPYYLTRCTDCGTERDDPTRCSCTTVSRCEGCPDRGAKPAPESWECACNDMPRRNGFYATHINGASLARQNPGSLNSCPDCGTRRP